MHDCYFKWLLLFAFIQVLKTYETDVMRQIMLMLRTSKFHGSIFNFYKHIGHLWRN